LWAELIREVDKDGSGSIDFQEFKQMMNSLTDRVSHFSAKKQSQASNLSFHQGTGEKKTTD
jgi:Ca2+-binding EF-hand superfamily protein